MSEEQERHLEFIKAEFVRLLDPKFRKGAEEHDSNLERDYTALELVDCAIEEAIDQVVYLLTIRAKIDS